MPKLPKISLVYTFFNQLPYLKYQILLHTYLYKLDIFEFELIVVDDGSDDGTRQWIEKKETSFIFPFKYIRLEKNGMRVGLAKNEGIKAAEGDYIYLSDGDTFCTATSYIRLIDKASPDYAVFGKRVKLDWEALINSDKFYDPVDLETAAITTQDWRGDLFDIPPAPYTHFSGANCMFPAEDLKKIKWVDDNWQRFGFDDYICALRWLGIIKKPLKAVNESIAFHVNHPNTMGDQDNLRLMRQLAEQLKPAIVEKFGSEVMEGGY